MSEDDPDDPGSMERWADDMGEIFREELAAKDAEIARLDAGFMKCLQDQNECDAWRYVSACRAAGTCRCALELELWCNRAVPKEGT